MFKSKNRHILLIILPVLVILISVFTTLALHFEDINSASGILYFENVSLMGEVENGSKLSVTIGSEAFGNGDVVFDSAESDETFLVVPTDFTADCFIRFSLYYTLGNDDLDAKEFKALEYLNNIDFINQGVTLHNENGEYGYSLYKNWYYLTLNPGERVLKVVTKNDSDGFVLLDKFISYMDTRYDNEIMRINELYDIYLKVKVQAVQAVNIAKLVDEDVVSEGQDIILSGSNNSLEMHYEYATVLDFAAAMQENEEIVQKITLSFDPNDNLLKEITGESNAMALGSQEDIILHRDETVYLPTSGFHYENNSGEKYLITEWQYNGVALEKRVSFDEIFSMIRGATEVTFTANWQKCVQLKSVENETNGFFDSTNVLKGGHSSLTRHSIRTLEFTSTKPKIPNDFVLNESYFIIDCGEKEGYIKAYWFKSGTYQYGNNSTYTLYDVVMYQKGVVVLNENSNSLFRNVGYYAMKSLDMTNWDINTDLVTNMSYMFYGCGYTNMTCLDLGDNFDTSNVTNMEYMFYECGRSGLTYFDLGDTFDTKNVTIMQYMFYEFGSGSLSNIQLGNKFETPNVINMNRMFYSSRSTNLDSLDLGKLGASRQSELTCENMFTNVKSGCVVICYNSSVKSWIEDTNANLELKIRDYDVSVSTLVPVYSEDTSTEGFLFSTEPKKGGDSQLTRQSIKSLDFVSIEPIIEGNLGKDYFKVDCGTIEGTITAYWVENGVYFDGNNRARASYDVIVYQEGGVKFNPDSRNLFRNVGYYALENINTLEWEINTSFVRNMKNMFYNCGYLSMTELNLGDNFNTAKVEDMSYMFRDCGYTKMTSLHWSDKFNTSNVKNMEYMFFECGYSRLTSLDLGINFYTKNVTNMSYMFYGCGRSKMTYFDLRSHFATSNVKNMEYMFYECGYSSLKDLHLGENFHTNLVENMNYMFSSGNTSGYNSVDLGVFGVNRLDNVTTSNIIEKMPSNCVVICYNQNVMNWLKEKKSLEYKVRDYNTSVSTLIPVYGQYDTSSGFLNSAEPVKGGNSNLQRQAIKSINFVSSVPVMTGELGVDYFKVDCGTISGTITAYWVKNGTYMNNNNTRPSYDVIVYQDGGVRFNPDSRNLFRNVGYHSLQEIDTTNWKINVSSIKNMAYMFYSCGYRAMIRFNLAKNFTTLNVTNMTYMFAYCGYEKMQTMSLGENFSTSNVTDMRYMFCSCGYNNLKGLDLGYKFNTSKVTNMEGMFNACGRSKMTYLNLRNNFNTSNVTNMLSMFYDCGYAQLKTLKLGEKFSTEKVVDATTMFACYNNKFFDLLDLGTFGVNRLESININTIFSNISTGSNIVCYNDNVRDWLLLKNSSHNIKTRDYDNTVATLNIVHGETGSDSGFLNSKEPMVGGNADLQRKSIKNLYFVASKPEPKGILGQDYFMVDCGTIENAITAYWIKNGIYTVENKPYNAYDVIVYQEGGVRFNPNSINLLRYVGYYAMETLDTTNWEIDISLVWNMSYMFYGCGYNNMVSLNIGDNIDTSNITNMEYMFAYCGYNKMTTLNLGNNFNTLNVTNMRYMFSSCGYSNLTGLDLGYKFDTSKVINMEGMFSTCGRTRMTYLNLRYKFDTSNVENMISMFYDCGYAQLKILKLGEKFSTEKVQDVSSMFACYNGKSFDELDLGIFGIERINELKKSGIFSNVSAIVISCYNQDVIDWLSSSYSLNYKIRDYNPNVATIVPSYGEDGTDEGFLRSTEPMLGGHSSLIKRNIKSVDFVSTRPEISGDLNEDYYIVDSGTIENTIFSYWIKNGIYKVDNNEYVAYDVIIYQEGGVVFNPDSRNLFRYVGYYAMENLDTTNWEIDFSLVWNMAYIFYGCGYNGMISLNLGDNINTSNITNMEYMFAYCGYNKMTTLNLGNNFNTSKVTNMRCMFSSCGYSNLKGLDLGYKFNTSKVINMESMFSTCGRSRMTYLNLRDNFDTSNVLNMKSMFYDCGYAQLKVLRLGEKFSTESVTDISSMLACYNGKSFDELDLGIFGVERSPELKTSGILSNISAIALICYNQDVADWLKMSYEKLNFKIRDYNPNITTLIPVYGEENNDEAFLRSTEPMLGGHSTLVRKNIKSLDFVSVRPDVFGILNEDYYIVDCGTNEKTIYAYWIKNGTYTIDKNNYPCYDVIIYQNGGVVFNPDSRNLFRYVGYYALNSIDTRDWKINTSLVYDMSYMFYGTGYEAMADFNLDGMFNTENVENMTYMFAYCGYKKMTYFNLRHTLKTSNVISMSRMFYACGHSKLKDIRLGDNFETDKLQDATYMFANSDYKSYDSIDLGKFGVDRLDSCNINNIFRQTNGTIAVICYNNDVLTWLQTDYPTMNFKLRDYETSISTLVTTYGEDRVDEGFLNSTEPIKGGNDMLLRRNIRSLHFTSTLPAISGIKGLDYFMVDCGTIENTITAYWICGDMFYYDGNAINTFDVIVYQEGGVKFNPDSRNLFRNIGYFAMQSFDTTEWDIDMSNVKNTSFMFYSCGYYSMEEFILGDNFKTELVTDMQYMFYSCGYTAMQTLELGGNFDTSNVINMQYMFAECGFYKLNALDLKYKFNTQKVKNMQSMFSSCGERKLTHLDLRDNFDTSNVENMGSMFYECGYYNLQILKLGDKFSTKSVTQISSMFACNGGKSFDLLDLGKFGVERSETLLSSGVFGNTSGIVIIVYNQDVADWLKISYEKLNFKIKDYNSSTVTLVTTYGEDSLEDGFLNSKQTYLGGHSTLLRKNIKSINFVSSRPSVEGILNEDYYIVDVGTSENTIFAYWIKNGTYILSEKEYPLYDVIVYQEGGVIFNPDSRNLFRNVGYYALNSIDTTNWKINTTLVKNMSYMFYETGYTAMTDFTLAGNFNTAKVENMSYMFAYCGRSKMTYFNLRHTLNTANVTDMNHMFYACGYSKLKDIKLGDNFVTNKLENASYMFASNESKYYDSIDLGKFGYIKPETPNISNIFRNTTGTIIVICYSENVLNWLKDSNTGMRFKVKDYSSNVATLVATYGEDSKDEGFLNSTEPMKGGNSKLLRQYIKSIDFVATKPTLNGELGQDYFVVDCGTIENKIFAYWIVSGIYKDSTNEFTVYDVIVYQNGGVVFNPDSRNLFRNLGYYAMKTLDTSSWEISTTLLKYTNYMFAYCGYISMTSLTLGTNINTSKVIDMKYMFYYCGYEKMHTLNLGDNFYTSNVEDMQYMFAECGYYKLTALDLKYKFNTQNVKYMQNMFNSCGERKLTYLNLRDNFDTSNVENMETMFYECGYYNLQILKLGDKFSTKSVTKISAMFACNGGKSFELLDLGKFGVERNETLSAGGVFGNTGGIVITVYNQDVANWLKTSFENLSFKIRDYDSEVTTLIPVYGEDDTTDGFLRSKEPALGGNSTLTRASIRSLDFVSTRPIIKGTLGEDYFMVDCGTIENTITAYWIKNGTYTSGAIYTAYDVIVYQKGGVVFNPDSRNLLRNVGYYLINNVDTIDWEIDTSLVKNMSYMFYGFGRNSITNFVLSENFNTESVENMNYMFAYFGRDKLIYFDLKDTLKTANVKTMERMFYSCGYSKLKDIKLGENFETTNLQNASYMFASEENKSYDSIDLGKFGVTRKEYVDISNIFYKSTGTFIVICYNEDVLNWLFVNNTTMRLKIRDYDISSTPTLVTVYGEDEYKEGFLNSTSIFKGGHSSLMRQSIKTLEFVDGEPYVEGVLGEDYFMVDCGTIPNTITAYWIKNGTYFIETTEYPLYDVIVYQEGGVKFNPDSRNLFRNLGYYVMEELDMTNWKIDTSLVQNTSYMFSNCGYYLMTSLNLGNSFDTSNVTSMEYMFSGCGYTKMTTLNLGNNFDTSKVVNMEYMFSSCGYSNLTALDLKYKFNTESVKNMQYMFNACGRSRMTYLNLRENFDTSNVTNMQYMFYDCGYSKLKELKLNDKFNSKNLLNANYMFANNAGRTLDSLDLGKFGIERLEELKMSGLFHYLDVSSLIVCYNQDVIDWLTITYPTYRFKLRDYSSNLSTLIPTYGENELGEGFLGSTEPMRGGNSSLTRQSIKSVKFVGTRPSVTGILGEDYFMVDCGTIENTITAYWIKNGKYYNGGTNYDTYDVIVYQVGGVRFNPDSRNLFRNVGYYVMEEFDTTNWSINTTSVHNMSYMFSNLGYKSMTSFVLGKNFVTQNVTDMSEMFSYCGYEKMSYLDVEVLDTRKVTNMARMFYSCGYTKLYNLKLGTYFETSLVTSVDSMFNNLPNIKSLDLSKFGENRIPTIYASGIFATFNSSCVIVCYNEDVKQWLVSLYSNRNYKVRDYNDSVSTLIPTYGENSRTSGFLNSIEPMKGGHSSLTRQSIKSLKFVSSKPIVSGTLNTDYYMVDCGTIKNTITAYWIKQGTYTVDTSIFDIYDVIVYQAGGVKFNPDSRYLFSYLGYYRLLDLNIDTWSIDTSRVENMSYMFYSCGLNQMKYLNLYNKFNTSNVIDMSYMFYSCGSTKMQYVKLGTNFDTSSVENMSYMFYHCGYSNMSYLDLGDKFDTSSVENMSYMFYNCGYSKLRTLNLKDNFDTSNVENMTSMFQYSSSKTMDSLDLGMFGVDRLDEVVTSGIFTYINSSTIIIVYNEDVKDWLTTLYTLNYKIRDYDSSISTLIAAYGENSKEKGFLNSTEIAVGGNSNLTRQVIKSIKFVSTTPSVRGTLNEDYFKVDCGTIRDTIFAYWIESEVYTYNNKEYTLYDVIVYQNGGVKFNPDSRNLFRGVGYLAMEDFSTSSWNITTTFVKNMSYMFYECGVLMMEDFYLASNFDTYNVKDMSYMFYDCGSTSMLTMDLGNIDTRNVTNMSYMFYNCGTANMTDLELGNAFDTSKVENMTLMFYNCGTRLEYLDLGEFGADVKSSVTVSRMFERCGNGNTIVYCDSNAYNFILSNKSNYWNINNINP